MVESNGNVAKTISNLRIIFTHDEELSQIKFDTFCQDDFSFSKRFQNVNGGKIDEESVGKIQDYLEQTYKLRLTQSKVFEILKTTSSERSYNPVQDFILQEDWDYVPRISRAIIDYLGAEDTPLVVNRQSCGLLQPSLVCLSLGASLIMCLHCLVHKA